MSNKNTQNGGGFVFRVVLPTVLAIVLFAFSIFVIIIPLFRSSLMDRKREMIEELTNSACSILEELNKEVEDGAIDEAAAKKEAVKLIRYLRYGEDDRDYFWIIDMKLKMIMHPYKPELEGKDLSDYEDKKGKKLFSEFVKVVEEKDEGFVDYMWQWKDDPTKIVPKLSFVKEFKPWGWIVGTGIYVEDVKAEIAMFTRRLMIICLVITFVLAILLFYILQQSFKIERQRRKTGEELQASKDRYRSLVETASEGLLLVVEGEIAFANKAMLRMLGYSREEFSALEISDIIVPEDEFQGFDFMEVSSEGVSVQLYKKNSSIFSVVVSSSRVPFYGKQGFVLIARDTAVQEQVEMELSEAREKFQALSWRLDKGVFRATPGAKGYFVEANPFAAQLLGFDSIDSVINTSVADVFTDNQDWKNFLNSLEADGAVKNKIIQIRKEDGAAPVISVSAVLVKDVSGKVLFCDGIIEDITERTRKEERQEGLIVEMQTALLYLSQPLKFSLREPLYFSENVPVIEAAGKMIKAKEDAVLVKDENNLPVGIVTDYDFKTLASSGEGGTGRTLSSIMNSPLITAPDNIPVYEAALIMAEKGVRHLAVCNEEGKVSGIVGDKELLQVQKYSLALLFQEIDSADSVEALKTCNDGFPLHVKALIDSGANARNVARVVANVSDAIVKKLIEMSFEENGSPPVKFAFVALGSEGRQEQTLKTDQDNAIIFDSAAKDDKEARAYFLKMGEFVCDNLDKIGYSFCTGGVMAKMPNLCKSLSEWEDDFDRWIRNANPRDLMDVNIYFDFRLIFGEKSYTESLKSKMNSATDNQAPFFLHLAHNSLQNKLPVGVFGGFSLESSGENKNTFNIKSVLTPVVDFARIYSLKEKIDETNTLERLKQIRLREEMNEGDYNESVQAYGFLMQIRFRHQVFLIREGKEPDNQINPGKLTEIEQATLKKAIACISLLQSRLASDFPSVS